MSALTGAALSARELGGIPTTPGHVPSLQGISFWQSTRGPTSAGGAAYKKSKISHRELCGRDAVPSSLPTRFRGATGLGATLLRLPFSTNRDAFAHTDCDLAHTRSVVAGLISGLPVEDCTMPRTGRSIEVEAEIATLIKSGDWPVGYRIGTQHEIAEQFRCSRSDVNRAFVSLRDQGMLRVEREPGGRSNCVVVIGVGEGADKKSD